MKKKNSIEHNSSPSNDPIDLSITNTKRNEHDTKPKRRTSPVINLYPERDVLMHHTNNIATGKPNVPQTVAGNSSFSSVLNMAKRYVLLVIVIIIESRKTYLTAPWEMEKLI